MTGRGQIDATEQIEQRAFTTAAGPDQHHEGTGGNLQIHRRQHPVLQLTLLIVLGQTADLDRPRGARTGHGKAWAGRGQR
jgi:hypothetical protein